MCEPWAWACAAAADDMRAGHPRRHCHQASAAPLQLPRPLPHPLAAAPTLVSCLVYRWCQAGLRQTTSHQSVRSVASVTLASFSVHCTLYSHTCWAQLYPVHTETVQYTCWLQENYAKASPIKFNNHHDLEWMYLKDSGYLDVCKIGVPPIIKHCNS